MAHNNFSKTRHNNTIDFVYQRTEYSITIKARAGFGVQPNHYMTLDVPKSLIRGHVLERVCNVPINKKTKDLVEIREEKTHLLFLIKPSASQTVYYAENEDLITLRRE